MCITQEVSKRVTLREWEKWENFHNDTQLFVEKWTFFKANCVSDRNVKNIHRIFEKIAEYTPYEFAKINAIAFI